MVDKKEAVLGDRVALLSWGRRRGGGLVFLLPSSIFHYVVTLWLCASSNTLISLRQFNCTCVCQLVLLHKSVLFVCVCFFFLPTLSTSFPAVENTHLDSFIEKKLLYPIKVALFCTSHILIILIAEKFLFHFNINYNTIDRDNNRCWPLCLLLAKKRIFYSH